MKKSNWVITKDLFLSQSQVQQLYSVLQDTKDLAIHRNRFFVHIRDFYILHVLLESGVRVFELVSLKVGDFQSGSLIIQSGKGGKKRTILLGKNTQKMIRDFIKVKKKILKESTDLAAPLFISERKKPYTTRAIRKRVKFWFSRCGFPSSLSCHSCRHTNISHMIGAGIDLQTVRDNVGHSSLGTTSLYSHATKNELDVELYK